MSTRRVTERCEECAATVSEESGVALLLGRDGGGFFSLTPWFPSRHEFKWNTFALGLANGKNSSREQSIFWYVWSICSSSNFSWFCNNILSLHVAQVKFSHKPSELFKFLWAVSFLLTSPCLWSKCFDFPPRWNNSLFTNMFHTYLYFKNRFFD